MTDNITLTLTVPYAGHDRTITGPATAIATAALLISKGLPETDDKPADTDDNTSIGINRESVRGSFVLICALQPLILQKNKPNEISGRPLSV